MSQFVNINTIEQRSGNLDVFVGSTPIVLGGRSRGLTMSRTSEGNEIKVSVSVRADGMKLPIESGTIGSLLANRDGMVARTIDKLDMLAGQLIFRVNRMHATGR
ncbi:MAG: hypothetical protein IIB87_02785, partial [Chloroflexi bacterium]|nr:hypothetical protein [Chloroflexota bacterium]